jgi:hypothetical protein
VTQGLFLTKERRATHGMNVCTAWAFERLRKTPDYRGVQYDDKSRVDAVA